MSRETSPEIDDELFADIYGKAYTGPSAPPATKIAPSGATETTNPEPVIHSQIEDEEEDNFGIPTDFTSRDKKFWDAKAKQTEVNFNKRKKEEMICKLCGDPNHFTQGCPTTLGMNKKTQEHFERVPCRDKRIRDLFSPETISRISNETGCKLVMNEKFLIVSSKEAQVFSKGVDRVHCMIQEVVKKGFEPEFTQEDGNPNPNSSPTRSRVLSPARSSRLPSPPRSSRVSSPPRSSRVSSPPRSSRFSSPLRSSRVSSPPKSSRVASPPTRSRVSSPTRSSRVSSPPRSRERSPSRRRERSPYRRRERGFSPRRERVPSPSRRSERSYSPRNERSRSYGRSIENRAREDSYRLSKDLPRRPPPQQYQGQNRNFHPHQQNQYEGQNRNFPPALQQNHYEGQNRNLHAPPRDAGEQEMDLGSPGKTDLKALDKNPRSMEELEMEMKREETEIIRAKDQQVDEENYLHRKRISEMRENYSRTFSTLRSTHSKQVDHFIQPQNVPQALHTSYPDPAVHNNMQYVGPTSVPNNNMQYSYHDGYGYGRYQA